MGVSSPRPADGALPDLAGLPGLEPVREQLAGLIAVIQAEHARRDSGVP
jgi:hypothetical protein